MGNFLRPRLREERGAAAVEFALVMPLLMVLLFGIIGYGYMLSFRQSISQAAAEGVRAAAVAPVSADREAVAFAAVRSVLGVTCNHDHLTCATSVPASCATCMTLTVTYDYAADPSKLHLPGADVVTPDTLTYASTVEISQ